VGPIARLDSVVKKRYSALADNNIMITQLSNTQLNLLTPEPDI
jgi:hypothetical protein